MFNRETGLKMRRGRRFAATSAFAAAFIAPLDASGALLHHTTLVTSSSHALFGRSPSVIAGRAQVASLGQHLAQPSDMVVCGGALWITDPAVNAVDVLSPSSGRLLRSLGGASIGVTRPWRITCSGTSVWVAGKGPGVAQLSSSTGNLLRSVQLPSVTKSEWIGALLASNSAVWADDTASNKIYKIEAGSGVASTVTDVQAQVTAPTLMTSDGSSLWVAGDLGNALRSSLITVNQSTSTVSLVVRNPHNGFQTLQSDPLAAPSAISTVGTSLWVANFSGNSLSAFSTADESLLLHFTGSPSSFEEPSAMVATSDALWVASATKNKIVALSPTTGAVLRSIPLPGASPLLITRLVIDGTHLYAMSTATGAIFSIDLGAGVPGRLTPSEAASDPVALATDATGTWIVNGNIDTVVEIGSVTGAVLHRVDLSNRTTAALTAIADDGQHLWVTAASSGQVFELTLKGKLVKVLPSGTLHQPLSVFSDRSRVWVTNSSSNSVTVFSATSGAVVWNVKGANCGFALPSAIAGDGRHVWVANSSGSSITELDASTGRCVRVLSGPTWKFDHPTALTTNGPNLWVASSGGSYLSASQQYSPPRLTELSTTTLGVKWRIQPPVSGFFRPTALAVVHDHLWLAGLGDFTVRKFAAQTGKFITSTAGGLVKPFSLAADGQRIWIGDPGASFLKVLTG